MSRLTIDQLDIVGRSFAAAAVTIACQILVNIAAAFYLPQGPHLLLLWLAPATLAAMIFIREPLNRLLGIVGLTLLGLPAAMAAEMFAHLSRYCLQ